MVQYIVCRFNYSALTPPHHAWLYIHNVILLKSGSILLPVKIYQKHFFFPVIVLFVCLFMFLLLSYFILFFFNYFLFFFWGGGIIFVYYVVRFESTYFDVNFFFIHFYTCIHFIHSRILRLDIR